MYECIRPDDWREHSLFDLALWKNGLAFKNIDFAKSGRPVIKIAELKNGVTSQTALTMAEYDPSVFVRRGDMLFSWSGNPDTSIDVFRWKGEEGWLNQHIFKVIHSTGVSDDFLFLLLKWLKPRFAEIARNKQTTGLGHVTIKDLKRMLVGIPDTREQERIVRIISPIQKKIELNREINETLEAMAQALFKDWFVDFGPTRAKMEGRAPYLAPELWDLFPDALDHDDRPVGWEFGTIGTFAKIKAGKRPSSKFLEPDGAHRVPVYGGNGISWYTKEPLYNPPFLITGRVGTLGTVFRVYESVWVSDNALCCFPIESKSFELLYFCLKSLDYDSLNAGSTQPLLTQTVLKSQEVMIGDQRVRDAFSDCIRPLFSRTVHGARESQTLAVVRDFLLPKLMSGEIRLRGAEKAVEAVP